MNALKTVLIGCLVLLLNNFLLLNYIGYFSKAEKLVAEPTTHQSKSQAKEQHADTPLAKENPIGDSQTDVTRVPIEDEQMISVLRKVAETDEFISILDNYQLAASRRYVELQKKFGSMDTAELFDVVQNAESKREREFALQVLAQGGFEELDTYQLKSILQLDSLQNWHEGKVLSKLLERRDPDALNLAKDHMSSEATNRYFDHDLIRNVFDLDPEFIQDSIDELDLTRGRETFMILSVALEDPKISKQFYEKHIDNILESNNSNLFNHLSTPTSVDLTLDQQNKILELLQSTNRQKRRFAMGMLKSVENLDAIREAFQNVERDSDKRNFIYSLVGSADNPEKKALAKELAASVDDSSLQNLFQ